MRPMVKLGINGEMKIKHKEGYTLGMVERLEAQRGGMLVSFKQTLKEAGVIMLV